MMRGSQDDIGMSVDRSRMANVCVLGLERRKAIIRVINMCMLAETDMVHSVVKSV